MAPEQCRAGTVTPATDVFGFGVTLYESLTGRLPFPGGSRRPFPQITVPPRPLRQHAPAVPAALEELVMACLAAHPEDIGGLPLLEDLDVDLGALAAECAKPAFDGFLDRTTREFLTA